jgi:transposase-like protein
LYRALDQFGQVIDVLVSEKRDLAATRLFFTRALVQGPCPIEVTTDRAAAYPRVLDELLPGACHVTEQYANNPPGSPGALLHRGGAAMRRRYPTGGVRFTCWRIA